MIARVISGGQTGADQAGWRAAKRCGIPTGGWMPHGFRTDGGIRPEFAEMYGAFEHESPEYHLRTKLNIFVADVTICFGDPTSPGSRLAYRTFRKKVRESGPGLGINYVRDGWIVVPKPDNWPAPDDIAGWFGSRSSPDPAMPCSVLNVAGNRESKSPGIGAWVEAYLVEVFTLLGHTERNGR